MSSAWRTFWRRFFLLEKKIEWTARELKRHPELRHMPPTDPYARRWLLPWHWGHMRGALISCGWTLAWALPWLAATEILRRVLMSKTDIQPWWLGLVPALCSSIGAYGGCAVIAIAGLYEHKTLWRRLRTELRRRGIPICIKCAYEGGDINAPRCPECGTLAPNG